MSQFLLCLVVTLLLEGTNGFQSNPRSTSSVISCARLSVTTTSNSVTDESSSSSKSSKPEVDYKAYGNGYRTVFAEIPYADCEPSSGSIPSDLKGSYFRNGPGKIQIFPRHSRRIHLFCIFMSSKLRLPVTSLTAVRAWIFISS